jgi:RNA polymerase-binding transcription factor DksA
VETQTALMSAEPDDLPLDDPETSEEAFEEEEVAEVRTDLPRGGPTEAQKQALRSRLMALRDQLARTGNDLARETLKESGQTFKVDHMADAGSDNFEQDMNLSLMAGEAELFQEIETAIRRLDGQIGPPYGACETCARQPGDWNRETGAPWIPMGRLDAVPYARLCVAHQEEQEEDQAP